MEYCNIFPINKKISPKNGILIQKISEAVQDGLIRDKNHASLTAVQGGLIRKEEPTQKFPEAAQRGATLESNRTSRIELEHRKHS